MTPPDAVNADRAIDLFGDAAAVLLHVLTAAMHRAVTDRNPTAAEALGKAMGHLVATSSSLMSLCAAGHLEQPPNGPGQQP